MLIAAISFCVDARLFYKNLDEFLLAAFYDKAVSTEGISAVGGFDVRDLCICDDPCFSKFGALRGSCPHPGRQFVGLLCVSLMAHL